MTREGRSLYVRIFGWFFGVVLVIGIFLSFVKALEDRGRISLELARKQEEITSLQKANEELKQLIEAAAHESILEKEAKRRLNVAKPGEKMVIIVSPRVEKIEESNSIASPAKRDTTWWHTVLRFFRLRD